MPLFSVIVPTYNRRPLLEQTLRSISKQTFTDYEIIVVDDGSSDGTCEWLQATEKHVLLFRQANRGPGAARNLGARHARGSYLAFLDSDDLWFPWTLQVYANVILDNSEISFIAGKPKPFYAIGDLASIQETPPAQMIFLDYLASGEEWRWWGVSSFVMRLDAFLGGGGFTDEWINGEDADLALRLGVAKGFVQITAYTFGYRKHSISAVHDFRRSLAGTWFQMNAEKSGRYPGGSVRAGERHRILCRHIRPIALNCLRNGLRNEAWRLYWATFRWHWSLRRWKFLLGFPFKFFLGEPFRVLNK